MLENELKKLIIKTLDLEDVTPEDIDPAEPLFYGGLGLDSLDALELAVALSKKYKISIANDPEENQKIFSSVNSMIEFVRSNVEN